MIFKNSNSVILLFAKILNLRTIATRLKRRGGSKMDLVDKVKKKQSLAMSSVECE